MDRVTQRLGRVAEGPSAMLNLPMLLGAFQPPAPATVFPGVENHEGYEDIHTALPGKNNSKVRGA
jgi:hypothetical protein